MNNIAYLSLGSNIDDRFNYLGQAVKKLNDREHTQVIKASSIYETDPVGYTDQACFLNMVIKIKTNLSPFELLAHCLFIEEQLGRKRIIRWGPRTIDLDILLYNQENIKTNTLSIPHPRMYERPFVLIPLAEIEPNLFLPEKNQTVKEFVDHISNKGVRLWKKNIWDDVFALFEN